MLTKQRIIIIPLKNRINLCVMWYMCCEHSTCCEKQVLWNGSWSVTSTIVLKSGNVYWSDHNNKNLIKLSTRGFSVCLSRWKFLWMCSFCISKLQLSVTTSLCLVLHHLHPHMRSKASITFQCTLTSWLAKFFEYGVQVCDDAQRRIFFDC